MFSRRKSRNVHDTSYTGVNYAASGSNQPSNGALAAALTIGQSLKQQGQGQGQGGQLNGGLRPPQNHRNSLLKRDSLTRSPGGNKVRNFSEGSFSSSNYDVLQTPPQSGNRRTVSEVRRSRVSYNVDDSFNDSYLDEINEDATHYNNAKMRDLRLEHTMSPPPSGSGSNHYASGSSLGSGNVRMVKKYIPTPNGIKVIEVPESTYQKEVARNNSMRSGRNVPRSSSMNSMSYKTIPRSVSTGQHKKSQGLSSLVKSPRLDTMAESEEAERNNTELQKLQQQIDHEKQVSKDLEAKRLEYEKLKLRRLENEKKILLLERDAYRDENPEPAESIQKPALGEIDSEHDILKDEDVTATSFGGSSTYEEDAINDEDVIPESSIKASSVVVDELDKKKIHDVTGEPGSLLDEFEQPQNAMKSEHDGMAELNFINQYSESKEMLNRDSMIDNTVPITNNENDFGIEEVPYDDAEGSNLAKQLRPTFDSKSETIDNEAPDINDNFVTLQIPTSSLNNYSSSSSVNSDVSNECGSSSRSPGRPVKSAMKNSSSFYNSANNRSKNPAQEAYLSLATAENTRMNSKLSASNLNDTQANEPANHYYPPVQQNIQPQGNQSKRMSTLRNSPSVQNTGLASRSFRPQSTQLNTSNPQPNATQENGSRMSGRSLRDRSSMQVNPVSSHPALQPNYQSPSKLKAAELYAKANSRPISSFPPVSKKTTGDGNTKQRTGTKTRTTLRDMTPQNHTKAPSANASNAVPQATNETSASDVPNVETFKSRLVDSDDEETPENQNKIFGGTFSSRYNDSDEDISALPPKQNVAPTVAPTVAPQNNEVSDSNAIPSVDKKGQVQKGGQKEKRKFSKLRKLFGKD